VCYFRAKLFCRFSAFHERCFERHWYGPNVHNNKLATLILSFPFSCKRRCWLRPGIFILICQHVAQCQVPLACTYLEREAASWLEGASCVCDQCPKRGARSFILPRPSRLWAEEIFVFLFVYPFWGPFRQLNLFFLHKVNWFFIPLSAGRYNFPLLSKPIDLSVAGQDQSAVDQPNNLAEGYPLL